MTSTALRTSCADDALGPHLVERVRRVGLAVTATGLAGSALASAADPRLAFIGVAFVLGWTRLVGL